MQKPPTVTLAQTWVPWAGVQHDLLRVVAGSLFIALCAQITIPLAPVPITGQTLGVLLTGAVLGSRLGGLAVLAYLVEGAAGLPVFAPGGPVGIARFVSPTAGYLIGFLPAAYVVGALAERGWDRRVWTTALAMIIGNLIIYACGLIGLVSVVPAADLLARGMLPFLLGDAIKIAIAVAALPGAWRLTQRAGRG